MICIPGCGKCTCPPGPTGPTGVTGPTGPQLLSSAYITRDSTASQTVSNVAPNNIVIFDNGGIIDPIGSFTHNPNSGDIIINEEGKYELIFTILKDEDSAIDGTAAIEPQLDGIALSVSKYSSATDRQTVGHSIFKANANQKLQLVNVGSFSFTIQAAFGPFAGVTTASVQLIKIGPTGP